MLKKNQHVETATDKRRHVEGMKKGMLKNGVPESGMLKLLQKKTACSRNEKRHVEKWSSWIRHVEIAAEKNGMMKEWKKACWKMEFLNLACWNCCRKKRHVEVIKTACWKMEFLNPACWKKIRHVESATDKKRHVEGMKKGMLKIEFLNPACWNCCRKKRHVEGMKNGMLKNGAADSGMLKLLQKKTACWRYKNGMLKNGAAESGMLKKNPACWNCNGKKTACWSKIRHVEVKSGMLKIRQKNGMCLHRSFCW
jgi:hypothetical protein